MIWQALTFGLLGVAIGILLGVIVGLSLGFRVGTRRTIMIFKQHFPTSAQLNAIVAALLKASAEKK